MFEPGLVFAELKVVVFLAAFDERLAIGGFEIGFFGFGFGDVGLVVDVVPAFVLAEVHIAGCHEIGDIGGYFVFVAGLGGADEVVEGVAHGAEGGHECVAILVGPLDRREVVLGCGSDDFFGVFVGAGEKEDAIWVA